MTGSTRHTTTDRAITRHRAFSRMIEGNVMHMKKALTSVAIVAALVLCGCASAPGNADGGTADGGAASSNATAAMQAGLAHRYASASEGRELLQSNEEYYAHFSQNDLDYRMQKTGATMEEYQAFAAEQVLDFTDDEKANIDARMDQMANKLRDNGYTLPPLDEIVFVKTTMAEECDVGAYTHETTIFLSEYLFSLDDYAGEGGNGTDATGEVAAREDDLLTQILWHELFHCLTRCNPDFRADMYPLIHFTVHGTDYAIPPSVVEYHISNPDVEHHDSSAVFVIDGKEVECFCDFVTTRHFEKEGDNFFDVGTTALVPVDGSDTYYTPEQAANFDEVFGANTDYVIDPDECLADNFAYAMIYGKEGPDEDGYPTPRIIDGILAYVSK